MSRVKLANDPIDHVKTWKGIDISVEWPAGSTREYTDDDGAVTFSVPMSVDYGYIDETNTSDGEEIDIYFAEGDSDMIWVVEQLVVEDSYEVEQGATVGEVDEYKYMLGYDSQGEAEDSYVEHMTSDHLGGSVGMTVDEFRSLLEVAEDDVTKEAIRTVAMKIYDTTKEIEGRGTVKFEYWYDPSVRTWYGMPVDEQGNQIGDTMDAYRKEDVMRYLDTYSEREFYDFQRGTFGRIGKLENPIREKPDYGEVPWEAEELKHEDREAERIAGCFVRDYRLGRIKSLPIAQSAYEDKLLDYGVPNRLNDTEFQTKVSKVASFKTQDAYKYRLARSASAVEMRLAKAFKEAVETGKLPKRATYSVRNVTDFLMGALGFFDLDQIRRFSSLIEGLGCGKVEAGLGEGIELMAVRIDVGEQRKMNADLISAGLDGNGRFQSITHALGTMWNVLGQYGYEPGNFTDAYELTTNDSGSITMELRKSNPQDLFSPEDIDNRMVAFQWYTHSEEKIEGLAYIT